MNPSIGEPECQNSSQENDLAFTYLDLSTKVSGDEYIHFSKLEILRNLRFLFQLSSTLAEKVLPEVTHICLLASSGMAIGIAVALITKRPLIFFRRDGWPKPESQGLGPRFLPRVPQDAKLALVDSHENTRYTSALCIDELLSQGIQVVQLITPISFDECIDPTWTRNIKYTYLATYSSLHSRLASKYSEIVNSEQLKKIILDPDNRFWLTPPIFRIDKPYYEFDVPGMKERPKWFLGKTCKSLEFDVPCNELSDMIVKKIAPDDEGRWDFFLHPQFVEEWARDSGDVINLKDYQYLIGTSHLGTALAIALAYYNQSEFQGMILFHLGRDGFVPQVSSLTGCKVLPIEMIITSGVYAVDVFLRIQDLGGYMNNYIVIFQPPSTNNWWLRSRLVCVPRLRKHGVKFISLSKKNK